MYRTHGGLMTGHSFTGHTAACAAGAAVQRIVKRDNLLAKVRDDGAYLFSLLENAIGQRDYVGDIRGRGFFIGIELVQDRAKKEPFAADLQLYARLRDKAFENGLICYPVGGNVNGHRGDIIILSPPYIASRSELEEIVDKLQRSLSEIMAGIAVRKA
jgi:adenosylmethionine-8-amino-7-oxononanoate aminotransferase